MGSNKTAFEKIAYFNILIGNDNAASVEGLLQQFKCIQEEFDELAEAVEDYAAACYRCEVGGNDGGDVADATAAFDQIRDGIADVLVTTFGLAHRAGIHADQDLQRVYESNMSKFLSNSVDAYMEADTIFSKNELSVCINETAPSVWALTSAADQHGKDGKFYPKGKLLKPSTFKEPDFSAKDHGFSGGFHDAVLAEVNYHVATDDTVEKRILDAQANAIAGDKSYFEWKAPDHTAALMADLSEAAITLRRYEEAHRVKGTAESLEKAEVNRKLAERFEATVVAAHTGKPVETKMFQGFGLGIEQTNFRIVAPVSREEFEQLSARIDTLTATVRTLQSLVNGPLE